MVAYYHECSPTERTIMEANSSTITEDGNNTNVSTPHNTNREALQIELLNTRRHLHAVTTSLTKRIAELEAELWTKDSHERG